jgi:hypothetical protein
MSDEVIIVSDNGDAPIMLARAPGQVADQGPGTGAIVYRGARGGNPNFDPSTGRFSGGGRSKKLEVVAQTLQAGGLPMQSGIPKGVDALVWAHRLDVVRDAARQMEMMDVTSAQKFLQGRVVNVNQVDINQFLADVRMQRISDLADSLETTAKSREARLPVRVVAPVSWQTKTFAGHNAAEVGFLVKRLEGRGWSPEDVNKYIVKRVKNPEIKGHLEQLYGQAAPKSGKKEAKK